ncbi:MAG: right-handed parallel beta-helix repeat-containing protein [Akkermansiaceae bacterium]
MKKSEAREILGLEPNDDPRAFRSDFEETLEYKQDLVKSAPNDELRFGYQQDLLEYKAALQVVVGRKKLRPHADFMIVLLLIAVVASVGWWGYQWHQKEWYVDMKRGVELAEWRAAGLSAIAARKWDQAQEAFREIDKIEPGSVIAEEGFNAIEQGKIDERNQQISYTLGESQAALEAGRWDEAERLAQSIIALDPENEAAQRKLLIIIRERKKQELALMLDTVSEAIEADDITAARQALAQLRQKDPQNTAIKELSHRIKTKAEEIRLRHERAESLYQQATALDTGEYSAPAMILLEEAARLNPTADKITHLYKKMGGYARALRVPQDYPTIPAAIVAARPRDIIRVAAGKYTEPLYIDRPIKLMGSPEGHTVIELPATEAAMITVTPTAIGTHISGFELRHVGFDHSKDRFSGITIQAKDTTVSSCTIVRTAGHGIAVLEGGQGKIRGCKILEAGWDGISVYGEQSAAEISDTLCQNNIQHGIGFWQGGSGMVTNTKALKNGLCGIVAMGAGTSTNLGSNVCSGNREAGILISEGVSAKLTANTCEQNLLSGIVARGQGTEIAMNGNVTNANRQAGILTHDGVKVHEFAGNQANDNRSHQIWRDAKLSSSKQEF